MSEDAMVIKILIGCKRKQSGQSMTEYLVLTIVVMVILGATVLGNGSAIDIFLNAVNTGFDRFSGFMSLP